MDLRTLLRHLKHQPTPVRDLDPEKIPRREVRGVTADSRRVSSGWVFVACPGATAVSRDGHEFVEQVCRQNPAAVVVGDTACISSGIQVPVLRADDPVTAVAQLAEVFHGKPSTHLRLCGVTGTDGKTSVTHILARVLQMSARRAAVLGTLGVGPPDQLRPLQHTTPPAEELSAQLAQFRHDGITEVAMEVSSHALALRRADGLTFALAALTHINRDHLDFHGSREAYVAAKGRLFFELLRPGRPAVLPVDHPWVEQVRQRGCPVVTWGRSPQADVWAERVQCTLRGTAFALHIRAGEPGSRDAIHRVSTEQNQVRVQTQPLGAFQVDNMVCAAACAAALRVPTTMITQGLCGLRPLPGRMESVHLSNDAGGDSGTLPTVIVDYAHTPGALAAVLDSVRRLLPRRGRIVLVFGCGGERDQEKRPLMGRVAAQKADRVFLADDNPRSEDPAAILHQIAQGAADFPQTGCRIVGDRAQAIQEAVSSAEPDDVVLICGKGHESEQIRGGNSTPFRDRDHAREVLQLVSSRRGDRV
ncbi:MAG: UDP-N-acetylmuramoyl-L-alanyl-D-glutamate--2,6-diaminopimelate ligase [Myxococcota bacterium]